MKKKLKSIFSFFFHPSPFKLGLVITVGFVWLAMKYYPYGTGSQRGGNWLLDRVSEIHQASIDQRLRDRGARGGSPDVAIVAVDELAVEKLGRWPWPRGLIAEMIDALVENGAKVIAFDAVFAEPDRNQAVISLERLKANGGAKSALGPLIEKELAMANTDSVMAASVKKQSDRVILGSFFENDEIGWDPYQEYCVMRIDARTPESKKLEQEEKPVIPLDSAEFTPPEIFGQVLDQHFDEIKAGILEKRAREKLDPRDVDREIRTAQRYYCARWLSPVDVPGPGGKSLGNDELYEKLKELWPELSKDIEGWKELSWEDAVERIKMSFLHNPIPRSANWVMNLPAIEEGSKHNAYFNAFPDKDGTLRRSNLVTRFGPGYSASLALKAIMVGQNLSPLLKVDADAVDPTTKTAISLELNDGDTGDLKKKIPIDYEGRLIINYAGDRYMFPHVSVADILNTKSTVTIHYREDDQEKSREVNKKEFFKDKYLVFGATAVGIYDLRVTPFSENYPGVETHANLVDNMIRDDYLIESRDWEEMRMIAFLFVFGILLSFALSHMGAATGLAVTAASIVGIYYFDKKFLFGAGRIVAITLPLLMIIANYTFMTFYKYLTEERKKKELKGTFAKYVSPAIVDEVLKDPGNIELGGKKLRMTVVFSDVRGFTTISEKLDPQALVAVLNEYLSPMTDLVFKNKGTLDKYMGDAIMSFFGAPIHFPDHAKMACKTMLEMMELLPVINEAFAKKGYPAIDIGIGANTGDMSVGNMGSNTVRSYTVMGDAVNLGSRLEGINKQYGTKIIISEFTYADIKDDFFCREVDWVKVKGKLQPVRIFELMGMKGKPFNWEELIKTFTEAFEKFHAKDFKTALELFNKCLNMRPDDGPSQLYVERCQELIQEPPPADWDGVCEMKTK